MTPTNRLATAPPNVLRGASIPNAIAGFGRPAGSAPPTRALGMPTLGVGVIAAMLALLAALLVALLVPLLGGRVP